MIDTPGLIEKNILSETSFRKIKEFLQQKNIAVDIVMFCERIDMYRIEPIDRQMIKAMTMHFGKDLWNHTILVFTRANIVNSPDGLTSRKFVSRRIYMIQSTVLNCGDSLITVALVENLRTKFRWTNVYSQWNCLVILSYKQNRNVE